MTDDGGQRERWLFRVALADGVNVNHELLGTSWTIERGHISGVLVLPTLPADFDGGWGLEPPPIEVAERVLLWFGTTLSPVHPEPGWGRAFEINHDTRSVKANVRWAMLVLHPAHSETEDDVRDQVDDIGVDLEGFIDDLYDWLEVLGESPQRLHEVQNTRRHIFPLVVALEADGGLRNLPSVSNALSWREPSDALEPEVWRDAVDRTNRNERPPEEHLLLRDSRAAMFRDDRRKAVIDAATAVEVALAGAIRGRMTARPDAESISQVLKNNAGVVELLDLAVALGVEVPVSRKRVMDQIAGPRNFAAHQGITPEPVTVHRAQETASEILTGISPL